MTTWDSAFFEDFISIRTKIYAQHLDFVSEELSDLRTFFGPESAYGLKMDWRAVVLRRDQAEARYLLCLHPKSKTLHLGYFETTGLDEELFQSIQQQISEFKSIYPQLERVNGPIQASIFNGYRFREKSMHPLFVGESLHQDFYSDLWQKWGFKRFENWDSFHIQSTDFLEYAQSLERRFQKIWQDPKIKVRSLNFKNWNSEIRHIHRLTIEAYDLQDTNDEVDEKIFAYQSEKLRPILREKDIKILEYDGKVEGFAIFYRDVQGEIRHFNRRKSFCPRWLNLLLFVLSIRFKKHPYLAVYVGKSKSCSVKWAMAKLAVAIKKDFGPEKYTCMISTFNSSSSGSKSTLPIKKTLYSRHFLMTLPLS